MSSIERLPETTISRLKSTIVASSPVMVVKELIENSLDAGAGSIQIEMDPSTLGKLNVRDNGCGVAKCDIQEFARPHSTSKITNFNDIPEVLTLGFRGEALASIADITSTKGAMKITSRTKDESVAYSWVVDRKGNPSQINSSAGSVGTTISLTNIFHHIPVREMYLKNKSKTTLEESKKLVLNYSLIYSEVRFSFKVISTPKSTGPYSPWTINASPSMIPKICSIISKDYQAVLSEGTQHSGKWKFRYVLPLLNPPNQVDEISANRKINILAVDRRLVTLSKPVTKKLVSLVKSKVPRGDVWIIDIYPPRYSYDSNVEPGKDDLQFSDLDYVLEKLEEFLTDFYEPNIATTNNSTILSSNEVSNIGIAKPTTKPDSWISSGTPKSNKFIQNQKNQPNTTETAKSNRPGSYKNIYPTPINSASSSSSSSSSNHPPTFAPKRSFAEFKMGTSKFFAPNFSKWRSKARKNCPNKIKPGELITLSPQIISTIKENIQVKKYHVVDPSIFTTTDCMMQTIWNFISDKYPHPVNHSYRTKKVEHGWWLFTF